MRRLILLLSAVVLAACGGTPKSATPTQSATSKQGVEILYFHGRQRCATCRAIETLAREVAEKDFADEIKSGKLIFRTIDISDPNNAQLAARYEVSWSSLFVNKWTNGHETINDLTEFGFTNARTTPEAFRAGLRAAIRKQLE